MAKNGKPEGFGILFRENGVIKSGNFSKGKLDGYGKQVFNKGNVFIGKFFQDQMDVKGYFFDKKTLKWFLFNQSKDLSYHRE